MIRTRLFTASLAITATMPAIAAAQVGAMTVRPESRVVLEGNSNIAGWACRTNAFEATIGLDPRSIGVSFVSMTKPVSAVAIRIPVRSLECGHNRMNQDLYRTLRAAEFPDILFRLDSYTVTPSEDSTRFSAMTVGHITVAGVTRRVEVPVTAKRWQGGAKGRGTLTLKMTDFGVKPPVALFGAIRSRNEIKVTFEVAIDRTVVVALARTTGRTAME
jgi:polyisoprenoid-binding protein YceI